VKRSARSDDTIVLTRPGGPLRRARTGRWHWRGPTGLALAILSLVLAGCRVGPSIDVLGSFFPAWMLATVIGLVITGVARQLFIATDLHAYLRPRGLVYACLIILSTLTTWLLFLRD
jgi:YtcA family